MSYTREDTELLPVKTPAQQELEDIDKSMHQPAKPPNYKWLREWDLVVEGESWGEATKPINVSNKDGILHQEGTALSLKDFRFTFSVEMAALQTPWKLTATVYNLPPKLVKKIVNEFTTVSLVAGYRHPVGSGAAANLSGDARTQATKQELVEVGVDPVTGSLQYGLRDSPTEIGTRQVNTPGGRLIFDGTIIWYERGRENATDTFLRIHANRYDIAWNLSMINFTLPANHTQGDILKECVKAMNDADTDAKFDIEVGKVPPGFNDTKSPRARTLYGKPRDIIRDIAQSNDAYCHIDGDYKLNVVKIGDTAAGSADPPVVVNSDTGMVGIPHQNMDGGMSAQVLLDNNIWPGTKVHLNEEEITRKMLATGLQNKLPTGAKAEEVMAIQYNETRMIASDGIYQVWSVTHHGDTRGNAWYTDFTTMKASPPAAKTN